MVLENLQYLFLLQLHSPFQLMVLDRRIVTCHLYIKNYKKQFKILYYSYKIIDRVNSFMFYDFVTF